jgi:hypothetical protein
VNVGLHRRGLRQNKQRADLRSGGSFGWPPYNARGPAAQADPDGQAAAYTLAKNDAGRMTLALSRGLDLGEKGVRKAAQIA